MWATTDERNSTESWLDRNVGSVRSAPRQSKILRHGEEQGVRSDRSAVLFQRQRGEGGGRRLETVDAEIIDGVLASASTPSHFE